MNKIRCLLVDDEELALDVLEIYIGRLNNFEVAGRCTNTLEANRFLQESDVDLIFLDIQMPGLNGMEWIKNKENSPKVIFCTAYDQFAVESYEVNAIDYLLKPISFERFEVAISKAKEIINRERNAINSSNEEYITVRSERKLYKIAVNDIIYIHSLSNYYKIVTDNKNIIVYGSLSELEHKLESSKFIRIHRSYLVSLKRIEAVSNTSALISGKKFPIGRKYKNSLDALYFIK